MSLLQQQKNESAIDAFTIELLRNPLFLTSPVWQKKEFNGAMQKLVYEQVFSDIITDDQLNTKQKNLLFSKMSLLTRLAEQLLIMQKMQKKDAYKSELLYPELLERKQYRLYEKYIRKDNL